jgi:hypothetical protein
MQNFRTFSAALAVASLSLGLIGPAHSQGVKPVQSQIIELGRVTGDLYYTVRPDGYHVVATFAEPGEDATPVRFETVLANNQSVRVSTPRHAGELPVVVEISRRSDQVVVRKATEIN